MRVTTVADVMSTHVVAVEPGDSFSHVAQLLYSAAISAVPVVGTDGTLHGVVSDADLMATAACLVEADPATRCRSRSTRESRLYAKAGAATAEELMTTAVETVGPRTGVAEAARRMIDQNLRWMPVTDDDGRVVGILSRSDILAVFLHSDESVRADVAQRVRERIPLTDPAPLDVQVRQGIVTLSGEVGTPAEAASAVRCTRRVEGVVLVVDRLHSRVDDPLTGSGATLI